MTPRRPRPLGLAAAGAAALAALAALAAVAAPPVAAQDASPLRQRTVYEDLQMFSQVLNHIRVNHPDEVDTHALFMAAVEGLVRAADPHSYVIPRERLSEEKERALRAGRLVGVPVAFRTVGGAHVVVGVHPASGAMALDILPGDELVAIDGGPVPAKSAPELDLLLAGPPDSDVVLTLERRRVDGSLIRLDRAVRRERVKPTSAVPAALLLEGDVGYIRFSTFDREDAADDLRDAVDDLHDAGMRRLVLDLRDNGGGLLREAADVASFFLPRGALIYTTEGRKKEVTDTVRVGRASASDARRYPLVLLVNEGTASAAELVAGALQDHDRALVAGRTTFGKALVMQGFPLTDGSVVMLVIGTVRTPCGRSVQREYRSISTRDYYRARAEERQLAGRPTCTTPAGRTVYGGGGIFPDHFLDPRPVPLWLSRIHELDLVTRWVGGFIEDRRADLRQRFDTDPRPELPQGALSAFRAFAAEQGAHLPDDDPDGLLRRDLLGALAHAVGGAASYYRVQALADPEIAAAAALLPDAAALVPHRD